MPDSASRSLWRLDRYRAVSTGRRNAPDVGGCDDDGEEALGAIHTEAPALAGPAARGAARARAGVLVSGRGGAIERGRCGGCRSIASCRSQVAPGGRRHATIASCALDEAAVGAIPVVRRAEEIARLCAGGHGVREIARRLGRAPSTISRELRRNAATRGDGLEYRATTAQWPADRSARRPKPAKLAVNTRLREYVQDRLAGRIAAPGGRKIRGPGVAWKGRRAGRRQDRRWAKAWSPEQIASRLRRDVPEDETMRISHEALYQSLDVQGRGAARSASSPPACARDERCACRGRASIAAAGRS